MRTLVSIVAVSLAIAVPPCRAQTTGSDNDSARVALHEPVASSGSGLKILAGYEVHRDHLRYTFTNPSSIDTDFFVPHTFTQAYVANNQWLVVSAAYPIGSNQWETEFATTPERQTPGSDLDTFYNPNDDVVVSGTDGDVRLRSFRLAQWERQAVGTTLANGLPLPARSLTVRPDRSHRLAFESAVRSPQPNVRS